MNIDLDLSMFFSPSAPSAPLSANPSSCPLPLGVVCGGGQLVSATREGLAHGECEASQLARANSHDTFRPSQLR